MDKTVTANFDSVDLATFAVKNVTDHFRGVKKVRVTYQKGTSSHGAGHIPAAFAAPFGPFTGNGMPAGMGFGSINADPLLPAAVNLSEYRTAKETPNEHRKTKVSITAPEGIIRQIESILHSGGGLGLKTS